VDDTPLRSRSTPEDGGDADLDRWLMTWFEQMLAEPVPARFLDLIERLASAAGM